MTEAAAGTRVGTIVSAEQLALNPPTGALPVIDDSRSSHPSQFYRVFIDGKVKTQSTELTTLVEKLADRLLGAGESSSPSSTAPAAPPMSSRTCGTGSGSRMPRCGSRTSIRGTGPRCSSWESNERPP